MLVMVGGLAAVYVMFLAPADEQAVAAEHVGARGSVAAGRHEDHAVRFAAGAGDRAAGAGGARTSRSTGCSTKGQLAYKNGRLLDAYRLLHGALLRDEQHEPARRLLLRVMGERDLRLRSLQAAATRADEELKFDEAAQQWEAVQALTLDTEPLNARARTESARLRQRAAQ